MGKANPDLSSILFDESGAKLSPAWHTSVATISQVDKNGIVFEGDAPVFVSKDVADSVFENARRAAMTDKQLERHLINISASERFDDYQRHTHVDIFDAISFIEHQLDEFSVVLERVALEFPKSRSACLGTNPTIHFSPQAVSIFVRIMSGGAVPSEGLDVSEIVSLEAKHWRLGRISYDLADHSGRDRIGDLALGTKLIRSVLIEKAALVAAVSDEDLALIQHSTLPVAVPSGERRAGDGPLGDAFSDTERPEQIQPLRPKNSEGARPLRAGEKYASYLSDPEVISFGISNAKKSGKNEVYRQLQALLREQGIEITSDTIRQTITRQAVRFEDYDGFIP